MGAHLWYHKAPWHPEAKEALKTLQARFLARNYDLRTLLPQELARAQEAVAVTEAEGDPYGILGIYQDEVRLLQRLCSRPIPESPAAQIQILRRLNASGGQGSGNVLDVTGMGGQGSGNVLDVTGMGRRRDFPRAQRLSEREMVRLVGSAQPTLARARKAVSKINEELRRGECVCFPVYAKGQPVGWYFVGNTID